MESLPVAAGRGRGRRGGVSEREQGFDGGAGEEAGGDEMSFGLEVIKKRFRW